MSCTAMYETRTMSRAASASCANAASFCADTVILDAMLLASIIIFAGRAALAVLVKLLACGRKLNDASWAQESR